MHGVHSRCKLGLLRFSISRALSLWVSAPNCGLHLPLRRLSAVEACHMVVNIVLKAACQVQVQGIFQSRYQSITKLQLCHCCALPQGYALTKWLGAVIRLLYTWVFPYWHQLCNQPKLSCLQLLLTEARQYLCDEPFTFLLGEFTVSLLCLFFFPKYFTSGVLVALVSVAATEMTWSYVHCTSYQLCLRYEMQAVSVNSVVRKVI